MKWRDRPKTNFSNIDSESKTQPHTTQKMAVPIIPIADANEFSHG